MNSPNDADRLDELKTVPVPLKVKVGTSAPAKLKSSAPVPRFVAFGPVVKVMLSAMAGKAVISAPNASANMLLEFILLIFNAHILRYLP
jgi:hypothetical protein